PSANAGREHALWREFEPASAEGAHAAARMADFRPAEGPMAEEGLRPAQSAQRVHGDSLAPTRADWRQGGGPCARDNGRQGEGRLGMRQSLTVLTVATPQANRTSFQAGRLLGYRTDRIDSP